MPTGRNCSGPRCPKLTHEDDKTKTDACQEHVVRPSWDGFCEGLPCSCWAGRACRPPCVTTSDSHTCG